MRKTPARGLGADPPAQPLVREAGIFLHIQHTHPTRMNRRPCSQRWGRTRTRGCWGRQTTRKLVYDADVRDFGKSWVQNCAQGKVRVERVHVPSREYAGDRGLESSGPRREGPSGVPGVWAVTCCRWCVFSPVLRRLSGRAWCLSQAGRPRGAQATPQSLDVGIRAQHSVPHPAGLFPAGVLGHWGLSPRQRTPPSSCLLPGPGRAGWVTGRALCLRRPPGVRPCMGHFPAAPELLCLWRQGCVAGVACGVLK